MKAAIKLKMVHGTMLTDLKPKDQVKTIKPLVIINKGNLVKLNKPNSGASATNKEVFCEALKETKIISNMMPLIALRKFSVLLCSPNNRTPFSKSVQGPSM